MTTSEHTSSIIRMAWEDRTTFDEIEKRFGLPEKEVINLMRREMKPSSFRMWRKRVSGRKTKHRALSPAWNKRDRSNYTNIVSD